LRKEVLFYLFCHYTRNRMHSPKVKITIIIIILEIREYGRRDPSRWPRSTLYPQKLALASLTSGGRSVGIIRSWSKATEVRFLIIIIIIMGGLLGRKGPESNTSRTDVGMKPATDPVSTRSSTAGPECDRSVHAATHLHIGASCTSCLYTHPNVNLYQIETVAPPRRLKLLIRSYLSG
jgi:hypothetical protein